ncbi:MAG: EamA family transporter [Candidatus Margulisbacteria bacterium]|jgi:multidrug transporter EmrE-like cation transporter|nr:EamA family transporter [Candidatus Margulisiibacteriota bacterium]
MQTAGMVLVPVLIGVVGQILLKKGMLSVGQFDFTAVSGLLPQFIRAFLNPYVFLGFAFYFLSSLFWMIVLSRVELSVAYPLLSLGYVFVLLASWLLFREPVSAARWLGVLVIICGVTLVSRS